MDYGLEWLGYYNYFMENTNGIGIHFRNAYRPERLVNTKSQTYWRDANNLDSYLFYHHNNNTYGIYFNSWYDADQISGSLAQKSNSAFGLKSNLTYNPKTIIKSYLGFLREEDRGIIDYGWDFGLEGRAVDYRFGNYRSTLFLQSDYDIFQQRTNRFHKIAADINTSFSSYTHDNLNLEFMNDQKQYYDVGLIPTDRNIIDQSRNMLYIRNNFMYNLSHKSDISVSTTLSEEKLNDKKNEEIIQTKVSDFDNQFNYNLALSSMVIRLGMNTRQYSYDKRGLDTDYRRRETQLLSSLNYIFGLHDQLGFEFDYSKEQWDTPDSLTNHEDRDTQRYLGAIRYFHRFSPLLLFQAETTFYLFHHIYIFKERSANNNWNRVLTFSLSLSYTYREFRNRFQSGVLANYTVYDYQDLFLENQINQPSYVLRQYYLSDSLYIPVKHDLLICLYGSLELKEKGIFYSDQFAEMVSHEMRNVYLDLFLKKKFGRWFNYDIGILLDQRNDWAFRPLKVRIRQQYSYCPFLRLRYPYKRHVQFIASINYRVLNETGQLQRAYATGQINVNYYF